MKKFLLSVVALAGFSFANAQTVTLSVNDAAEVQGTLVEETLKEDGSLQARKHVQPLESLEIDGYVIKMDKGAGTSDPALYYAASTKPEEPMNLRVYKNNVFTLTAPENKSISKVTYVLNGKTEEVEMSGATTGTTFTWTNGTGANIQIVTLNVTLGEGGGTVEPEPGPEPGTGSVVELNADNAAEIEGELFEETMKEDGSGVQAAKHVQPLESLEIDGYVFTFASGTNEKTAPAYYWPTSTNANGKRSIRLYTGNTMTITAPAGVEFTKLVSTPDNSSTTTEIYSGEAVNTYTFTAAATTRINILSVYTGEAGEPVLTDVVFENDFQTSLDGFTVKNMIENAYEGWRINSNPKCAIANSYLSDDKVNVEAESWLISKELDLAARTACSLSFEQGFGFTFPEAASEFYTVKVRDTQSAAEAWTELEITNYPAAPASGNWTKEWALNTFDLSEFDGKKIEIALVYKNDGESSRAWEVKNFVVKGTPETGAVEGIEAADAPVEYYTIQGVKVAEPENGLYIRVQNGKATKVLVRK